MTMAVHPSRSGFSLPSLGLALLIELALLAAAGCWLVRAVEPRPVLSEQVPLALLMEQPPAPTPPAPPQVRQPTPPALHKVVQKTVAKPAPVHQAPQPPTPAPDPVADKPVTTLAQPTAFSQPPQAEAVPAPQPAPAPGKPDPNIAYAGKVRTAVQAAVVYPPAAASLRFSGRVRVEFHLRDGVPGQARVLIGSGIGMIDRAALQSVQNAAYPQPDAELRGHDLVYQVWVNFER